MILDYFNLKTIIKQRITFQDFFDNIEATNQEEKKFRKAVRSIFLRSIINQKNSGIRKYMDDDYVYNEILVFEVILESKDNIRFVEDLMQASFPNPIIIIFKFDDEYRISLAQKRLHRQIKNQTVVEEVLFTDFFGLEESLLIQYCEALDIEQVQCKDLKSLYEYYCLWAQYHKSIKYIHSVPELEFNTEAIQIIQQIEENEEKIRYYQEKKRKSRQVSDKMSAHTKVVSYKKAKKENIEKLREAMQ